MAVQNRKDTRKNRHHLRKRRIFTAGILLLSLIVIIFAIVILVFKPFSGKVKDTKGSSSSTKVRISSSQASSAPASASINDWQLVLVNLRKPKPEMNPDLSLIGNIYVDNRIEQSVNEFLTAAQSINPNVHLISGYRSVAYQAEIFNAYIQQTMNENPGWTEAQAKAEVMKTSQPPESSEHETGLAIDMSAVDELNAEDPATARAIADIAPNYGFVLRFPEWGTASTGIDYEDWHFRYVGVENAKYMTENKLTLEDYVERLSK